MRFAFTTARSIWKKTLFFLKVLTKQHFSCAANKLRWICKIGTHHSVNHELANFFAHVSITESLVVSKIPVLSTTNETHCIHIDGPRWSRDEVALSIVRDPPILEVSFIPALTFWWPYHEFRQFHFTMPISGETLGPVKWFIYCFEGTRVENTFQREYQKPPLLFRKPKIIQCTQL